MKLKPNTYYLIGNVLSRSAYLNQQYIMLVDETGKLEKDLFYMRNSKWTNEINHDWLVIATELVGFSIMKEWSNKEDMLADMFMELM